MALKKVGIPRALFYYQYYPLWKTFLEELGAEIVVSDRTTKKILDDGVKNCVDEACLPLKLYHGHVLNLKDRVDYLFIPRFTSITKNEYVCPKFGGLPDIIRNTLKDIPELIDAEVNLRHSKRKAFDTAFEVGSHFSGSRRAIRKAFAKALKEYRSYRNKLKEGAFASDILDGRKTIKEGYNGKRLKIALIGHSYNLNDSYLNMDILKKIREDGVDIVTVDMIDHKILEEKSRTLNKRLFWYFGSKAMGSALHLLDRNDIDGIVYIMSFGCGVDSFVCDLIERRIRRGRDLPFTVITLDEHSGEAGLNTRIEAFLDMIRWRNEIENNVSAPG